MVVGFLKHCLSPLCSAFTTITTADTDRVSQGILWHGVVAAATRGKRKHYSARKLSQSSSAYFSSPRAETGSDGAGRPRRNQVPEARGRVPSCFSNPSYSSYSTWVPGCICPSPLCSTCTTITTACLFSTLGKMGERDTRSGRAHKAFFSAGPSLRAVRQVVHPPAHIIHLNPFARASGESSAPASCRP